MISNADKLHIISHQGELAQWKEKGFALVVSPPSVLQIDLDDELEDLDEKVCSEFGLTIVRYAETKSKSGGTHRYIKLNEEFEIEKKIRLQLEFGSDPHREYLAFQRFRLGITDCIVMIEANISKVPTWAIDHLI